MNKPTAGEWMYSKYNNIPGDYGVYSLEENGSDIAIVRGRGNDEETLANAKLISSAPELLEILTKAVNHFTYPNNEEFHGWIQEAERLIYKITEDEL